MKKRKENRRNGSNSSSSGGSSSSSEGITMEMSQVALGAVFGAAVAVNATLQSLQESGSFLVQSPSSSSAADISNWSLPPPLTPRLHKRAFVKVATDVENDQASFFRAFLNEEELDDGGAFQTSEAEERLLTPLSAATTPSSDTSAIVFQEDLSGLESDSLETHQRPRKLQVKRKSMEASLKDKSKAECCMKGNDEEDSSTEDGDAEWDSSNSLMNIHTSTRRVQRPKFIPLLPQMAQSEEAMSAMLQHTTNTVLETLSEAKERRDQMLENAKKVELPEEQTTLNLMSRFIDALINVSDSLQLVHSALFPSSEGPQTRSQTTVRR
ncbi:unnamed protein product [Calypogeia fissa]